MIKKILSLFAIVLTTLSFAYAQTGTAVGTIVDKSGETLIGATVMVKGTTVGTITDIDGNFKLTGIAAGEQTLVASFIGYASAEQTVTIVDAKEATVNFTLVEDVTALDELIVIGYGVQKKEDKTGAVSTISSKDFNRGSITSAQELVTGKISGVQITSGGGAPGSGTEIRIRGGSSLNASNDPLIIIDGIPIDNDDVSGMRNPLNLVNPNDIETFTVLKDASATAIYGSRASNGVVIITTKGGTQGKTKINYQGSVAINTVTKTVGVLSSDSYRKTIDNAYPLLSYLMGEGNTNWNKEIFGPSVNNAHNISVAGNVSKILPYRFSVGYDQNNGILNTSKLDRITTSLNLNPKFFDDHLSVKAAMKYMNVKNQFADEGAIGSAMTMDPTQTVYDADKYADYGGYYTWLDASSEPAPIPIAPKNPVAQLKQKTNKADVNRFVGNLQFDYKFHFLPDLKANLNVGADYSNSIGKETKDALAAFDVTSFNRGGDIHNYSQKKKNELLEYYMQYDKEISNLNSRFSILGGYSWQHFWKEDENHTFFNEPDADGNYDREPYNLDRTENYLVSFFGRMNYSLNNRYLLTFTLRNDGSSRFSEKNKWGLFPSAAIAWNIKKESFMSSVSTISNLKLRLGFGVTGQQDVGSDYPYLGTYTVGEPTAMYVYYNPGTGQYERVESLTYRPNGYDENLKWEETTTYNMGLDYGMYDDRITGAFEVYFRQTTDLLSEIPVAAGSNFKNSILTNIGNTENKGVELSITGRIISRSDFVWKVSANCSYNKREITKLTAVDDPNYIGVPLGDISGGTGNKVQIHQVGQIPSSFFVYKQVYDNNGKPIEGEYEDLDGDGNTNNDTDDLRAFESSSPDFIFGLSSNITYKKWDCSISGHGSAGNYVYNNIASNGAYTDRLQTSGAFISNITDDIYNTGFQKAQYLSDYYVQNATFFRLDNILIGYNFDTFNFKDLKLRVYGSVNNVFVITGYEGIDPEVFNGIDNNTYPRPRTFLLGVNLSF